jgi:hypothetical protein
MITDILALLGGSSPEEMGNGGEAAANRLLRKYFQYNAANEALDFGAKYLMPDEDAELNRESRRLEVIQRKRALGMPVSTDDYERATNEDVPFHSRSLPIFGGHALQAIPEPGFMSQKTLPFRAPSSGETIKEIFNTTRSVQKGADHAHSLGTIARLLARRG